MSRQSNSAKAQIETGLAGSQWWKAQRTRLRRDLIFITKQVHLLSLLVRRPELPWPAKIAGAFAITYIFSPFQLIPTFIPVIGQMDDLLVLFLGTKVVRKFTPATVLNDCEKRAELASSAWVGKVEHILVDLRQSGALAAVRPTARNACGVSLMHSLGNDKMKEA
jgi:uncharacterized membrane protein YkvA (DUF1232 family)